MLTPRGHLKLPKVTTQVKIEPYNNFTMERGSLKECVILYITEKDQPKSLYIDKEADTIPAGYRPSSETE
jgi:hypothetical protein